VASLAMNGDISKINLLIGDISAKPLPGLPMNATASLFSNAKTNATREDIAIVLIHMVLQAVGSSTILSSLESGIKDFVLIGNLTCCLNARMFSPQWRNFTASISAFRNTASSVQLSGLPYPTSKNDSTCSAILST